MKKINRYPGIQPFSRDYRSVFFGRSRDIEELYKYLNVNKLTVLHGKSGLGKSSLLNAGLIPKFEENNNYLTVFVRFGSYQEGNLATPKSIFIDKIKEELIDDNSLYFKDLNIENPSMWQYFKTLEWDFKDFEGVLLVLDQFEEVFTYPKAAIEEFGQEFSELVNDRMPEDFQKTLYSKANKNSKYLEKHAEQIQFTANDMAMKILVGIRSDRLSYLDQLSDYVPNILKNLYGLLPLNREQAKEAIILPATKQLDKLEQRIFGNVEFETNAFTYDNDLLEQILDKLSIGYHQTIEPFLLQIICQHIEKTVKNKQHTTVTANDIDDLDSIIQNYYINVLQGIDDKTNQPYFTDFERLIVRYLVEQQLINTNSTPHTRISLDQAVLEKRGATPTILKKLVDERLLRQEPNTVSGMSYEVSHDTLIDPILQSAIRLGDLDDLLANYYNKNVNDTEQAFVEQHFINTESVALADVNPNEYNALLHNNLAYKDNDKLRLYAMFKHFAIQRQNEKNAAAIVAQTQKTKRATGAAILAATIGIVAIGLFFYGQFQRKKAEAATEKANKNYELAMKEKALREKGDVRETLRIGQSFEEGEYYKDAILIYNDAKTILQDSLHIQHGSAQTDSLINVLEERIKTANEKSNQ